MVTINTWESDDQKQSKGKAPKDTESIWTIRVHMMEPSLTRRLSEEKGKRTTAGPERLLLASCSLDDLHVSVVCHDLENFHVLV
jgi:hypothetical protein